jgi:signal transduction histidine kinase
VGVPHALPIYQPDDLLARLRVHGVDLERTLGAGTLLVLDADELLARVMMPARPLDPVRALDAMVDILRHTGHPLAAIRVEELWSELLREPGLAHRYAHPMARLAPAREAPAKPCTGDAEVVAVDASPRTGRAVGPRAIRDHRARRLLAMTATLADAISGEQVVAAVIDRLGDAIGASSVALFLADGDGATLAGAVGYTDAALAGLATLLPASAAALPVVRCLREGRPLWLDDGDDLARRYPDLATAVATGICRRAACLPMTAHGAVLAALVVTFDDTGSLDDDEQGFLLWIARHGGLSLERLRLLEAGRRATAAAEAAASRAELLHDLACRVIVASDIDDVHAAALDTVEQALGADHAAILVIDDDGDMRFRAWRGLSESYRAAPPGHAPWPRAGRDPEPITIVGGESLRAEGIAAVTSVPLVSGGRLLGALALYFATPRQLAAAELDVARVVAGHVAAALTRLATLSELRDIVHFHDTFTGILGHDLRNPLNAISTVAELALGRSPDKDLTRWLSRIVTSTGRMARMIDQLLDFTRTRLGSGIPVRPMPLDLAPLVRQIVDELEDAHPEATLRILPVGDTVGGWDGDRLGQVFSNLVGNAIQHGAGAVEIVLDGSSTDFVRVEVHSPGFIAPDVLPRIFEPLARGDRGHDRSQSLGLGLYITREIVNAHGGAIDVVSTPARGTTFLILLPRGPSPAA